MKSKMRPSLPKPCIKSFFMTSRERLRVLGEPVSREDVREIGTEWSSLPKNSYTKMMYRNRAEEDEQRYLNELVVFLKDEPYIEYLKDKSEGDPVESIEEFMKREQETLNCLICEHTFSTHHNKREHLLSRGHLCKLTIGFK